MPYLLILREQAACLIILLILFLYSRTLGNRLNMKKFALLNSAAIINTIFDALSIVAVNTPDFPSILNRIIHIVFCYSAVVYSTVLLLYALTLTVPKVYHKRMTYALEIFCVIYLICVLFLGVDYAEFEQGGMYCVGPLFFVSFVIAFIFCIISLCLLIISYKRRGGNAARSLVLVFIIYLCLFGVQFPVRTLYFTSAVLTLLTFAIFISVENPVGIFMDRAYNDAATGLKNRARLFEDFRTLDHKPDSRVTILVCDLNGLKRTNDTYGHAVGDKMIYIVRTILVSALKSAYGIYRIGGDEFVVIYMNVGEDVISSEIDQVYSDCQSEAKNYEFPVSVAIGYAVNNGEKLEETFQNADVAMYNRKVQMKQADPSLQRDFGTEVNRI